MIHTGQIPQPQEIQSLEDKNNDIIEFDWRLCMTASVYFASSSELEIRKKIFDDFMSSQLIVT